MANQVEIDVVLTGAEEASRGLNGVGETAGKMADRFNDENSKLGEGLSSLTGNVEELVGSVKEFGSVATTVSKSNKMSFLALVPAVGAVAGALYGLYEAYLNISGAAEEAEKNTEAMAAAASDLESKLESLAEKGVIPTSDALDKFIRTNIKAQLAKEALQTKVEKLKNEFENLKEAQDNVGEAQKGDAGYLLTLEANIRGVSALRLAQKKYVAVLDEYREKVDLVTKAHADNLPKLKDAAKEEKALEEQSAEATLARVRENIALLNTLKLREAEIETTGTQLKVKQIEISALKESALLRAKENEEDAKKLSQMEEDLKAQIARFNKLDQLEKLKQVQIDRTEAEANKTTNKAIKRIDTRRIKELAIERQKQADLKALRQLELEEMRQNGASALRLLTERYNDEFALAGNNQNQQLIAQKRYQLGLTQILKDEQAKREASKAEQDKRDKERIKQAQMMALESLEFDLQMQTQRQGFTSQLPVISDFQTMQFETERELELLKVRYDKEIALAEGSQSQITEINRRAVAERNKINVGSSEKLIELVGEITRQYGAGLAEAVYTSALMGESMSKSIGEILFALGKQASVESLVQTAKGVASLFIAPQLASNHFAAAGLFAGAAAAAGIAGKSLGGGGGGGGGSASATPTGAPTTAPTPQREQAEQAPMVFNINFGGAVIYDTKRSAEQALADRITSLQNTRRRGAPRRF
jgi:uncharacterized protein YsxB (DUF464 family)